MRMHYKETSSRRQGDSCMKLVRDKFPCAPLCATRPFSPPWWPRRPESGCESVHYETLDGKRDDKRATTMVFVFTEHLL